MDNASAVKTKAKRMAKEVWDKKNPKKTHKDLTPKQEAAAKARAKAAGRPYPNAVDNIAIARKKKTSGK